jgi:hypothetical protein
MTAIDLNSDLGESYGAWRMGEDETMLGIVSSANVACGFHAGDPAGIWKTVKAAAEKGVSIGAHVSYPDRVGFGRRDMDVTSGELICRRHLPDRRAEGHGRSRWRTPSAMSNRTVRSTIASPMTRNRDRR